MIATILAFFVGDRLKVALWAAVVVGVLMGIGGIYMKGRIDASHAMELANLRTVVAFEKEQRKKFEIAARVDQELAESAQNDILNLEERIRELEHATANPSLVCLDAADVRRLRELTKPRSR